MARRGNAILLAAGQCIPFYTQTVSEDNPANALSRAWRRAPRAAGTNEPSPPTPPL